MMQPVLEMVVSEDLFLVWKRLAKEIRTQNEDRNQLAHSALVTDTGDPKDAKLVPFLAAYPFKPEHVKAPVDVMKHLGHLEVEEIEEFNETWKELHRGLMWFVDELRAQ